METDEYAKVLATNLVVRVLITEMASALVTAALVEKTKRYSLQAAAGVAANLDSDDAGRALGAEMHAEIAQMFSLRPVARFED